MDHGAAEGISEHRRSSCSSYDIVYHLNQMFAVIVWLFILYIDLATLECLYHIDIEYI